MSRQTTKFNSPPIFLLFSIYICMYIYISVIDTCHTFVQALQSPGVAEVVTEPWLCAVVLLLFDYVNNGD